MLPINPTRRAGGARPPLCILAAALLGCAAAARADDPAAAPPAADPPAAAAPEAPTAPAAAEPAGAPPLAPTLTPPQEAAVLTVSPHRLKEAIDFLAAPERGGRPSGSPGHRQARDWIRAQMAQIGLEPLGKDGDFLFPYPSHPNAGRLQRNADGSIGPHVNDTGYDVIGLLRGSDPDLSSEVLVLLAHYDHLGVDKKGVAFAGAFDDASGVAVALEVARALKAPGAAPRRSLLFLITDDEENGLSGARAWLAAPTLPLDRIVLAISADPLGRRIVPDYGPIVLAGLERSPQALDFFRETVGFAEHDVVFVHRSLIPRFHSDHDCFYELKPPIPAAWFTNPGMTFYHTVGDTPDTIDYRILLDSTRYAARALAYAGNTNRRFAYTGVPPITAESALAASVIFRGLLRSTSLTEAERTTIGFLFGELEKIEKFGRRKLDAHALQTLGKAFFFLFQLGYTHPGLVPPPFPEAAPGPAQK
ncbi:MAG: M20/M25/M40 family metallo-hydrolase [Planctomycetes bacterium]|nr:M20/M25/M40 family metallo-hydrolase [Planctomycetota bacterium]